MLSGQDNMEEQQLNWVLSMKFNLDLIVKGS